MSEQLWALREKDGSYLSERYDGGPVPLLYARMPVFPRSSVTVVPVTLIETAELDALRAAVKNLVEAPALSGVRGMVAGWNGEDRPEGRYAERHPAQLGANIRTTCGRVYSLDEAMEAARAALKGGEG